MKRFLSVISVIAAAISLAVMISCVVTGIKRSSWTVASAEITFVGLPNGIVFGEFEDQNGNVHSEMSLYFDVKFSPKGLIKGSPWVDPEPYYGKKIRIIYDPAGLDLDNPGGFWRYCDCYDNWLGDIIVSGIIIAVSAVLFVMLNKKKFIKNA